MQKIGTILIYIVAFLIPILKGSSGLFDNGVGKTEYLAAEEPLIFPPLAAYDTSFFSFPVKIGSAPTNEAIVINDHDTIKIFYINRPGNADRIMVIQKTHIGWSEPKPAFQLPGQAYYALQMVKSENGELVCVFHQFGTGDQGYKGRHLDLWVNRRVH
ncbi:MAG: hypothetical protein WDZ72_09640, partial [Cyclobacteriaceae bacterium]